MKKTHIRFWTTVVAMSFLMFGGISACNTKVEGEPRCYKNLPAYSTWKTVRPILDKAVADRFLSIGECNELKSAYDAASSEQDARINRNTMLKAYDEKVGNE